MTKTFFDKLRQVITVIFAVCLVGCMLAACGPTQDNGDVTPDKTDNIKSIAVTKTPDKTEYFAGEEFTAVGGEITVTYRDGTKEVISMTDPDVSFLGNTIAVSDPSLTIQNKNVTVVYGEKEATFRIRVSLVLYTVTFEYNDDSVGNKTEKVKNGERVKEPEDPERDEYIFDGWYSDKQCTMLFDFGSVITKDTSIYAKWLEMDVYHVVSFDYNYKGAPKATEQKVKDGGSAVRLSVDPTRYGYRFDGWYRSPACTAEYDFSAAVTEKTSIYAKWTKTAASGTKEYVFEAENTDLTGKTGKGLSGTTSGTGMIQTVTGIGASGDKFIGYQYANGCSITFAFISDADVTDAKIVVRLSAEHRSFDMNKDIYRIELNGTQLDYGTIKFTNVPPASSDTTEVNALPFKDYVVIEGATLVEGLNTVELCTINNEGMAGTTVEAKAPLIDCIKVTTSAILDWSAAHGLPKNK